MNLLMTVLAQAEQYSPGESAAAWRTLVILLIVILGLFGIVLVGVLIFRGRMLKQDATTKQEGLTLEEVRRMYRAGDIDGEEYERLKKKVTEQAMLMMPPSPTKKGDDSP